MTSLSFRLLVDLRGRFNLPRLSFHCRPLFEVAGSYWEIFMKITRIRLEPHDSSVWAKSGLSRDRLRDMLFIHKMKRHSNPLFDFPGKTITSEFRANLDSYVYIHTIMHKENSRSRYKGHATITLSNRADYLRSCSLDSPELKLLHSLYDSTYT